MKIAYEPHPVSPERKAELVSNGFKVVDIRFKPSDASGPISEPQSTVKKTRKGGNKWR